MSSTNSQREKLDMESSEDREARLGQLLTSMSSEGKQPLQSSPVNPIPSRPIAVPESDVLARVRAFLPQFQASNTELLARAQQDPASVNMENGQGERYIAMDLGLGVFDAPKNPNGDMGPVVDTQVPEGLEPTDESSEDDSTSDDSSSSEDDSDDAGEITGNETKI